MKKRQFYTGSLTNWETTRLLIKEPQRVNDGMPVIEIEELMTRNGFYRESYNLSNNTYSAVYKKRRNQ
ncbi:hypothetical protein RZO55_21010 [Clostridium boliviensis]|uniref:Uncharacterized protein n=1 Tax=Clostridium boliviensis TaxID=318465 RepID=A0ABU4GQY9_9CLOT|nr:hypothetical protein [Clostridium boliviensis]MDW2800058.1 hypothetical protein [Clostridium boliviensis]